MEPSRSSTLLRWVDRCTGNYTAFIPPPALPPPPPPSPSLLSQVDRSTQPTTTTATTSTTFLTTTTTTDYQGPTTRTTQHYDPHYYPCPLSTRVPPPPPPLLPAPPPKYPISRRTGVVPTCTAAGPSKIRLARWLLSGDWNYDPLLPTRNDSVGERRQGKAGDGETVQENCRQQILPAHIAPFRERGLTTVRAALVIWPPPPIPIWHNLPPRHRGPVH